jgi:hypothetical protein
MSSQHAARARSDPAVAAGLVHPRDTALDDLRFEILARIRPTLTDIGALNCHLDRHGSDVTVHLAGPAISEMRRQAIAVRILDAVRSMGQTYGHVDLAYETQQISHAPYPANPRSAP